MPPELPLINSIYLLLASTLFTFLGTAYWSQRKAGKVELDKIAAATALRDQRIIELEKQLAIITSAVIPISTAFQSILIKELTHYHTPELDGLLQRVGPPSRLNPRDTERMDVLLRERERDMGDQITPSERDAARMLPMVMRRALAEQSASSTDMARVQMVLLPEQKELASG